MVVDVLEEETGGGWFAEFDHDVTGVEVCMNKVIKEKHILIIIRNQNDL